MGQNYRAPKTAANGRDNCPLIGADDKKMAAKCILSLFWDERQTVK